MLHTAWGPSQVQTMVVEWRGTKKKKEHGRGARCTESLPIFWLHILHQTLNICSFSASGRYRHPTVMLTVLAWITDTVPLHPKPVDSLELTAKTKKKGPEFKVSKGCWKNILYLARISFKCSEWNNSWAVFSSSSGIQWGCEDYFHKIFWHFSTI